MRKQKYKMPMRLQFFADPGGDGAGPEGGNGGGAGEGTQPLSFDEFLAQGGNQAEFDRRTNKAIQTAVSREKEKWEALADDKLSEAEKLAKMTKDEQKTYMQNKKDKELSEREKKVARAELMAEAKNTLTGDGLPVELAEVLDYTDADTCKRSMETVKSTFQKAVEAAVEERLKGDKPPKKPDDTTQTQQEEQLYSLMMGR